MNILNTLFKITNSKPYAIVMLIVIVITAFSLATGSITDFLLYILAWFGLATLAVNNIYKLKEKPL